MRAARPRQRSLTSRVSCLQTYIGQVLVSVNPFKNLPIYTPQVIQEYQKTHFFDAPPHM